MKQLILTRDTWNSKVTLGTLLLHCDGNEDWEEPQATILQTLENPWLDNKRFESCIPLSGGYQAIKYKSKKFGLCAKVENAGNLDPLGHRTGILFHAGNTAKDTTGCILVGLHRTTMEGEPAISQSKSAMAILNNFMDAIDYKKGYGEEVYLDIVRSVKPDDAEWSEPPHA